MNCNGALLYDSFKRAITGSRCNTIPTKSCFMEQRLCIMERGRRSYYEKPICLGKFWIKNYLKKYFMSRLIFLDDKQPKYILDSNNSTVNPLYKYIYTHLYS